MSPVRYERPGQPRIAIFEPSRSSRQSVRLIAASAIGSTEAEVADVELVRRARDGDRDAFDLLMTSVIDHLYRIGRLILRDTDRAEDAVQETLVRCWRHLPSLRDAERFDPWLNRLLMHAIADEGRRHRAFTASVVVLRAEPRQPD